MLNHVLYVKIAVASEGDRGLDDIVSTVFGKARKFTIIEVVDDQIKEVKTIENPGASYRYGSGPIAVKSLVDLGVDAVIASEFGPSVTALFEERGVKMFKVRSGIKVSEALSEFLSGERG